MRQIIIIAHDIRSCHNVGALLRTADGFGVEKVFFTGYTPYPTAPNDTRLPHIRQKIDKDIHKTALGAEKTIAWEHATDVVALLDRLRQEDYGIVALEQSPQSVALPDFIAPDKTAILLGREVEGIAAELLERADVTLEIPMFGTKESFNVTQSAAIALYHIRCINT